MAMQQKRVVKQAKRKFLEKCIVSRGGEKWAISPDRLYEVNKKDLLGLCVKIREKNR
jgi:hypothetical protein